jgi:hypothetical protein
MITVEQANSAVELLKICRYFPSSDIQGAQVAEILIDMVETKAQLDWLVKAQTKRDWTGPADMRRLFCSRFQALDDSDRDPERAYFEREAAETERRIAEYKEQQKLLGEAQVAIDVTPAIRLIDRTTTERRLDRTTADLHFERVQQSLGKEIRPIYIPATAKRTPKEHAALIRGMEAKLGIVAPRKPRKKNSITQETLCPRVVERP